ncbi:uncharacterized protein [Haliotis asinina]|uniref:uncharacterized protein n=1 Tax=Haliotis asinina TaxID=109174 RepID=UPI003531C50B
MRWTILVSMLPLVLGQNLLLNGEIESMTHWDCCCFKCELTTIHHQGQHAVKVTGRTQDWNGPSQTLVNVKPSGRYRVSGYAKLLNDLPHEIGQNIGMDVEVTFNDGRKTYISAAFNPLTRVSDGWVQVKGDFDIPAQDVKSSRLYWQGPSPGVNFIVDSISLTDLTENTNWRGESDAVIDRVRKSDINFKVTLSGGVKSTDVEIDVVQTKKAFPFGTAVTCKDYLSGDQRYQDFINKHFNWGVTQNAIKWDLMERQQGHIDYDTPINAIKKLRSNGLKVRAHNIVWSVPQFVPQWVRPMTGNTLRQTVRHRIHDIVNRTKDLVEHWDVNNENLHGFWFQNTLNDRDYNLEIFRIAHKAGPNVKLFLNDYNVVADGGFTTAYRDQAIRFKNSNVGLYGVGVQCHFADNVRPDPTLIKEHLDTIAQAGVPIWVTELDVYQTDEKIRADWYETAFRAFYGHPAVEGIMFWGFWSNNHYRGEPASLVTGSSFRVNAAGQRYLDLTEKQWMTNETHTLSQSGNAFKVRGFHGDYEVIVRVRGKEVPALKKTFTLGKSAHTVNLNVHQ